MTLHCNTMRDFKTGGCCLEKSGSRSLSWLIHVSSGPSRWTLSHQWPEETTAQLLVVFFFCFVLFFWHFYVNIFFSILFFNKHFKTASLLVFLSLWWHHTGVLCCSNTCLITLMSYKLSRQICRQIVHHPAVTEQRPVFTPLKGQFSLKSKIHVPSDL